MNGNITLFFVNGNWDFCCKITLVCLTNLKQANKFKIVRDVTGKETELASQLQSDIYTELTTSK